jgi:hypothetical protein
LVVSQNVVVKTLVEWVRRVHHSKPPKPNTPA